MCALWKIHYKNSLQRGFEYKYELFNKLYFLTYIIYFTLVFINILSPLNK